MGYVSIETAGYLVARYLKILKQRGTSILTDYSARKESHVGDHHTQIL